MRNSPAVDLLVATIVLAGAPAAARAERLFAYTFDADSGAAGLSADVGVSLSVMTGVESPDWATVSFGRFTADDEGRTVTLTPDDPTAPDFDRVAARLTDGTRHTMFFEWQLTGGGAGSGLWEPAAIWGDPEDPRVDLAGYVVDGLGLRVDRLTLTEDVRNGSPWTDVSATFTLTAEGRPVPEPAAAVMIALPLLALSLRRRRQR